MGQRDPLVEYQREGFTLFEELVDTVKTDAIRYMYHVEVAQRQAEPRPSNVVTSSGKGDGTTSRPVQREGDKIGRNQACPCGSGKKYKRCHGAPGAEALPV
jgi:preprotein translocase subunit SecA